MNESLSTNKLEKGQTLIEILLAIALAAIILPAIAAGIMASRNGTAQQKERFAGTLLMEEAQSAIRSVREKGWTTFALNGTYHPVIAGSTWALADGPQSINGFTRQIVISDVYREDGAIVPSGGALDPSTKKAEITISWPLPIPSSIVSTVYLTRYLDNLSFIQTAYSEFMLNTRANVDITNTSGGEVTLSVNTKAKWCEPAFSSSTIDLPDGPPVAVAAKSNLSNSIPNDVFVGTSPTATESVKLAYVTVSANSDPPVSTLEGTFTLDATKYSSGDLVPTGIGLDNNFRTNDVKYYTSTSGKLYAIIATTKPDKEVIAVLIDDNQAGNAEFQDYTNKIYKYWTHFNTRILNPNAGLDSGFKDPTSNAAETSSAGDNDGFASNPTRGYTNNSSFALDSNSGNGTGTSCGGADKDKHRFYNYNFGIPAGATINGIEVRLDARVDSQVGTPFMCIQISWDGGITWTTEKVTNTLNTSEATYILGGSSDLWGRTWTDSNFSNANFRLRVVNVASNNSRDFSLDWASAKVYYSLGAGSNDQAPFEYGGTTLTVMDDRGYVASGGYLYVFDLNNIDSKSSGSELDQLGCRIQLDGYDCLPGSGVDRKYSSGQTGTTWSDTTTPAHNDCSDGGNIELYATNDIYGVTVAGNNYIFIAVGAGTNPEFNLVNATNIPDSSSSPSISSTSCGRYSGGNSSWKLIGTYDFNTGSGTEEAANSVFAKSDGTRAYISSNGTTDSKQFYILNTANKSSPTFLSGSPSTGPSSGYYQGAGADGEMYPRRSLTVLNGQRVVLVGKDGIINANDAKEYQVLNSESEATPNYCGGINYNDGFNDLTSVSEADGDNYVYMVANNTLNELKIIQGGPDGTYLDTGTIESVTIDAGYSTAFNAYSTSMSEPTNTDIKFQFAGADPVSGSCSGAVFNYVGPDGTDTSFYTATESAIFIGSGANGYKNPARCFRYKGFFMTTDYNSTPVMNDMTVNYSP